MSQACVFAEKSNKILTKIKDKYNEKEKGHARQCDQKKLVVFNVVPPASYHILFPLF
jgi:hypothetical protein